MSLLDNFLKLIKISQKCRTLINFSFHFIRTKLIIKDLPINQNYNTVAWQQQLNKGIYLIQKVKIKEVKNRGEPEGKQEE